MKITVAVRTRNEEQNIGRFCSAYSWADEILVADGESSDRTVEIAKSFKNVKIRTFSVFKELENGLKRNPHAEHLNFLVEWAEEENADWIIHDDCDCFPNKTIKESIKSVFGSTDKDYIYITRLYLWKDEGHFPRLAKPFGEDRGYAPSLWAWKASTHLRFDPSKHQAPLYIQTDAILRLHPPYALLHCPWQNDEMVDKKLDFYRRSGQIPTMAHPLEIGGKIEPLPEWAVE